MDGGHSAENIEEKPRNLDTLAEGDSKTDPMKDNLSPDGLSPEPKDVEPRTNCPGILDRKSPNRQVINNSPLIPFGDAPLNAEQASTKPVADPKPEPVPATMADRKAVHSLLIDRPYGEIVATMDWACRSTGRRCCAPRCVRNTSRRRHLAGGMPGMRIRQTQPRHPRRRRTAQGESRRAGRGGAAMSGDGQHLEAWKKADECRDFPQPLSDYLWSLEFEHRPGDAKPFIRRFAAVCLSWSETSYPKSALLLLPQQPNGETPPTKTAIAPNFFHLPFPSNKNGGLL